VSRSDIGLGVAEVGCLDMGPTELGGGFVQLVRVARNMVVARCWKEQGRVTGEQ
jgi:hypothetical protein